MGIDGIKKGGGIPPRTTLDTDAAGGKSAVNKTGAVDKPFSVEKTEHAHHARRAGAVDATQGSSPLSRLKAGQIDVNAYVDLKIEEATKGVHGLPPAELAEIKKVLRDQIATDPSLVDLVKQSTGSIPDVPEDG